MRDLMNDNFYEDFLHKPTTMNDYLMSDDESPESPQVKRRKQAVGED